MMQERTEQIQDGLNTPPRETIPQGTVKAKPAPAGLTGPHDLDDMVTHTGEARGLADTAYHSLEPDAPTVGAARRGQQPGRDLSTTSQIPSSSTGPD